MSADEPTPDDEAMRRALHELPDVAPPEGFYEGLIRQRHRRARMIVGIGLMTAGAIGLVVVAHSSGVTGHPSPELAELISHHEDVAPGEIDVYVGVPAPYQAPAELGSLHRDGTVHIDDGVQVVYEDGDHLVSVFEQAGQLDDGDMPADASPLPGDGNDAWMTHEGGTTALVVRRHHVVYVVVGDATLAQLAAIAEDLPDGRSMSLSRRLRDAMDDLVQAFGLG